MRQFSYSYANYGVNVNNDAIWTTFLSGLNFKNSSYNPVTNNHTNRAILSTLWVGTPFNGTYNYLVPFHIYFTKGDALVKFQMEHFRVGDGLPIACSTVNGLPHSAFCFEIQGVE